MNYGEKDIKVLIEEARRLEVEALLEIRDMVKSYAEGMYWEMIGKYHGNKYFDDYVGKVQDEILKSIKNFTGTSRKVFYGYINKCILNMVKNFCRDHIKSKYKFMSLNEEYEVTCVSSHFLKNGNAEEFVVHKMIKKEIWNEHMMPGLSKAEQGAISRKINDVETIEEYAKKVNCKENTIRAHESKALKKMQKKAEDLREKYHLHF